MLWASGSRGSLPPGAAISDERWEFNGSALRGIQQWEKLPAQRLAGGYVGYALQKRIVRCRADAVSNYIDDRCPSRARRAILERTVHHQGVMEYALACLQFDRLRIVELFPLLITQDFTYGLHVTGQACDRKEIPEVAARDVIHTTIIDLAVVQGDPASEMSQWLSSCPIRIILMPRHDASVERRL